MLVDTGSVIRPTRNWTIARQPPRKDRLQNEKRWAAIHPVIQWNSAT